MTTKILPQSGVYIIEQANRVLYVGESKNVKKRLCGHPRNSHIKDRRSLVRVIYCENHKELENHLILKLKPRLNGKSIHYWEDMARNKKKHLSRNNKMRSMNISNQFNFIFGGLT